MLFNTVKSKIILISSLMLVTLCILISVFAYVYLQSTKLLLLDDYSFRISNFAQKINKDIIRIENNAKDLALQGEMFYHIDKNKKMALFTTINIFKNYEHSLGGGIWFEPNIVDSTKRLYCIYVYRNKDNQIIPDEEFESEKYNYLNKSWYKEIFNNVNKNDNVAWSLPYYEKEGSNTLMVTAGSGIYSGDKLIGISTVDWEISSIIKAVSEIKPTKNSFALFGDLEKDAIIATNDPYIDNTTLLGKPLKTLSWYNTNLKNITYFTYHNQKYIPYVKILDNGMILILCIPKCELFDYLVKHVIILFLIFMMISITISALLYYGLKKYIDQPIKKLTDIAHKIGKGDLNAEIKLEKPLEFAQLADTFNIMTQDIKNISEERQKIESELSLAKAIQTSSLPNVFPPFPENHEFEIYAGMEPAKEVGGDFYDFYFIDDKNFMFLIADVSGKGIPAALFMMTTKTLITYVAQSGLSPKEMIEQINQKICVNNKQGFFITMLVGIVNIETGKITFINCGHNPPMIKKNNRDYKYLQIEPNIVLGAFEESQFSTYELQLEQNDTVFIYTDGITEAMNKSGELYGEERLANEINLHKNKSIKAILENIRSDIKDYSQEMPQSDDMTMLIFKYCGNGGNKQEEVYRGISSRENYNDFVSWLDSVCQKLDLNIETDTKLHLISEELYTNIFSYAYETHQGEIEVILRKENDVLTYVFADSGIPYNPLEKPDPDVTLPPESREQGGLGIFIVKNSVNEISYEFKDGKNILSMKIF